MPVVTIVRELRHRDWAGVAYGLAAVGGAVAVAYALRAMRRTTVRQLRFCILTAGAIGIAFNVLHAVGLAVRGHSPLHAEASGVRGLESFLLYVPALFVIEEVFFRGALDAYLHHPDEGTGWVSAFFLSALWGLWHLPLFFADEGFRAIPALLLVQVAVGVPLSLWWRRSGNLVVPGTTHALIDAVRNALQT